MKWFDKLKWYATHFLMKRAAERGEVQAQLALAADYLKQNQYQEAWEWYETAAVNGSIEAQIKLAKLATERPQINDELAMSWFLRAINNPEFNLPQHPIKTNLRTFLRVIQSKNHILVSPASIKAVVSISVNLEHWFDRDFADERAQLRYQINLTVEKFVNKDDHNLELALQFIELYNYLRKSVIGEFSTELLIKIREIAQSKIEAELESYELEISEMSTHQIAQHLNVCWDWYPRKEFWEIRERIKMLANYNERAAHIFLNWHITGKVHWRENSAKELEKIAQHFFSIATKIAEYTNFEKGKIDFHCASDPDSIIPSWHSQQHPIGDVLIIYHQEKNKLFVYGYNREGQAILSCLNEEFHQLCPFRGQVSEAGFFRSSQSYTVTEIRQRIKKPEFKESIIEDIYNIIGVESFRSSVAIKARAKLWNLTPESQVLTTFFMNDRQDKDCSSSYMVAQEMLFNFSSVALSVLQHPDGEAFMERINASRHRNKLLQMSKYLLAEKHLAVCEYLITVNDYDDCLASPIITHLATLNFNFVKSFCEQTSVAANWSTHKEYLLICIKYPELFDTLSPKFYDITKIRNVNLGDYLKEYEEIKKLILHSENFFTTFKGPKLANLVAYIHDLPNYLFASDNNLAELLDREDVIYLASLNWAMAKKAFQRFEFSVAEIQQILCKVNIPNGESIIENEFWSMAFDRFQNIDDIVAIAEAKSDLNGLEALSIMRTKPNFDEAAQAKFSVCFIETTDYFLTLIEAQALKAQQTWGKEAEVADWVLAFANKHPIFRVRCGAILLEMEDIERTFYCLKSVKKEDPGYQFAMRQCADALFAGMIEVADFEDPNVVAAEYYHKAFLAGDQDASLLKKACLKDASILKKICLKNAEGGIRGLDSLTQLTP